MPHHGRGGSRHIGRFRIAAAKLITQYTDLDVSPEDIKPVTGSYRTSIYHDVYRWEVFTKKKIGHVWVGASWQRLGEFVQETRRAGGCHYNDDRELYSGKAAP
jgi:hypothetical protein